MPSGRTLPPLALSPTERETLNRWIAGEKTSRALAQRARLILACAEGRSNREVSAQVGLSFPIVGMWRRRFLDKRLDGLLDEPRSGAPRKITDEDVERVIALTLETTPADGTHWTTRSMAERSGLSQSAVSRIWRAFALEPRRSATFRLSGDPLFIERVRDVAGLYLRPPDKVLVLCVDEESAVRTLDRTAPLLPMRPGQVERLTHDYTRHGISDLLAALDAATNRVAARRHRRQRSAVFRRFLDTVDASVPVELDVHLILDNSGIHETAPVRRWLGQRTRCHLHITPPDSPWHTQAARWIVLLAEKQLRRGVYRSTRDLEEAIARYIESPDAPAEPFVWTKSHDRILASLARMHRQSFGSTG